MLAHGFGDRSTFHYPFTHRDRHLYCFKNLQEGIVPRRLRVVCQASAARRIAVAALPTTAPVIDDNDSRTQFAVVRPREADWCDVEEYID